MTSVPSWYAAALLALAAYRCWRLAALDTISEGLRRRVTRLGDWQEHQPLPPGYREYLATFISCPWCLGAWLSIGWWLAWLASPHTALLAATPFALSALVGLVAKLDG